MSRRGCLLRRLAAALGLIAAFPLIPAPTLAQIPCAHWIEGPMPAALGSPDGPVFASVEWDPDGGGPEPSLLIIGGSFPSVGGVAAENLAAWDGVAWRPVGGGVDGIVRALAVYNGQLIVGGSLLSAGGLLTDAVAGWNGSYWTAMGDGMPHSPTVNTFSVYNGQLYAGVDVYPYFRRWDAPSSVWVQLAVFNGSVHVLLPYGGSLYAGGAFDEINSNSRRHFARWNGSGDWADLNGGVDDDVHAMVVHNGSLYLGGDFREFGDGFEQSYVVEWDGSFFRYTDCGYSCSLKGSVRSLASWNGELIAGGSFPGGGVAGSIRRIAVHTGISWSALGGGIGEATDTGESVETLCVYRNQLHAGGLFGIPHANLTRWDGGTSWLPVVDPPKVAAIAAHGPSKMALAGAFTHTPAGQSSTGYHVAIWDGFALSNLTTGTNGPVHALTSYSTSGVTRTDYLYVGGEFTSAGGVAANHVALWTEGAAGPFNGWSALGSGFNGDVLALARLNGKTVAGGSFSASGATPLSNVARWDGSSWAPMGSGMNGPVLALKSYSTSQFLHYVVAGGTFTTANGTLVNGVASWRVSTLSGDTPWTALGVGFNGTVTCLERHDGSTYAGGTFTASGATLVNHVARYAPATGWVPVGSGLGGLVYALKSVGGVLYAAGNFPGHVARFDGSDWVTAGDGTNGDGLALAGWNNELLAGGLMTTAGAGPFRVVANGTARFLTTGVPFIITEPTPQVVSQGEDATFSVEITDIGGFISYQWRKDGVPLFIAEGSQTPEVRITDVAPADSGLYDCVVFNSCGADTSIAASLTVDTITGIGVGDHAPPWVLQIRPNPFRRVTQIEHYQARPGRLTVDIFDVTGRTVRRLIDETVPEGLHESVWDGRDDSGRVLPAGSYFMRLASPEGASVRRITRLR